VSQGTCNCYLSSIQIKLTKNIIELNIVSNIFSTPLKRLQPSNMWNRKEEMNNKKALLGFPFVVDRQIINMIAETN